MSRKHLVKIESDTALSENTVIASQTLIRDLGISDTKSVKLSFGLLMTGQLELRMGSGGGRYIHLSPKLLTKIHCPRGISLHIRKPDGDVLKFGPVLGIFAPRYKVGRFGAHTPYIKQLVRFGKRMGMLVYVFSPSDINYENNTTQGYIYRSDSIWQKGRFPLPDVVYDRIPSRRIEAQNRFKQAKNRLRELDGIITFNDRFMDKWRVHRLLAEESAAAKYLPKTRRYEGQADLESFLSKYHKVYLKPTGGSQGHGIIKVMRMGSDRFSYVVSGRGKGSAVGYKALAARMRRIIGSRRYIIQQGLYLATVGGRHFDIRLLMQKDSSGNWLRTKTYARVAAAGRITSNISTGAEGLPLGSILRRAFGARSKTIGARVRNAGQKLAPLIEKALNQNFGELGLDIGVDRSGRVWLIEVNSKPFRHMTTEKGSKMAIIRSIIRPLSYTLGISGFHKMKQEPEEGGDPDYELGEQ